MSETIITALQSSRGFSVLTFEQLSACTRRRQRHLHVHLLFFSLLTARHRMSCPTDMRFSVTVSELKQVFHLMVITISSF